METERAIYTPTTPGNFRYGTSAVIIGVKMVKPSEDMPWRPCLEVLYPDGVVDYVVLSDARHDICRQAEAKV